MKNKKLIWIGIAVIVVIAIVAYYFMSKKPAEVVTNSTVTPVPKPSIVDSVIAAVTGTQVNPITEADIAAFAAYEAIHPGDYYVDSWAARKTDLENKYTALRYSGLNHQDAMTALVTYDKLKYTE